MPAPPPPARETARAAGSPDRDAPAGSPRRARQSRARRGRRPGSIAEREAVLARLGAADQDAALAVDPDRLAAADRHLEHRDPVAAAGKVGAHRLRYEMLDLQLALIGEDSRRLGSLLRVHAAVEKAVQEGGVTDRLVLPAHDPERHHRAPVLD